jgi:hypothetical protein
MSTGNDSHAQLNPAISNILSQLGIAASRVQSTLTISRSDFAVVDSFNLEDATTRAADIVELIESSSSLLTKVVESDGDIRLVRIRSQNNEVFITCGKYDHNL